MEIKDNFKYSITFNQKALIHYFKAKKISLNKQKEILKKVNATHYLLLSYFIYCCTTEELNKLEVNGVLYTQIDDKLILNNLPLLTDYLANKSTRVNKLKKWVKRLEDFGFIKRYTLNRVSRYVAIDEILLYKLNLGLITLNPLESLESYCLKELGQIKKEYSNKLPYNNYDSIKCKFFEKEHFEMEMEKKRSVDLQDLIFRFKLYLDATIKNQNG
jgi:hypothetical protein